MFHRSNETLLDHKKMVNYEKNQENKHLLKNTLYSQITTQVSRNGMELYR